jgi:hypothetical protein
MNSSGFSTQQSCHRPESYSDSSKKLTLTGSVNVQEVIRYFKEPELSSK